MGDVNIMMAKPKSKIGKMTVEMKNRVWAYLTEDEAQQFNKIFLAFSKEQINLGNIVKKSPFVRELLLLGMEQWNKGKRLK